MILFNKDFMEQGATVHINTRNETFLHMHFVLKKMGIQNNRFFLAIRDRDLMGYDPHNLTDPSEELRLRIAAEAKLNPWYYFRELIRIGSSGSSGVPFMLHRANLAQMWCFLNCIDTIETIPRQNGKTMGALAISSWLMFIAAYNIKIGMFAKGAKLMQQNVARLKEMRDGLPKYLIKQSIADENNKEGISYAEMKTQYLTFVAQSDKNAADDMARGQTLASEHWDEPAFFDNLDRSYPTATSAMDAAKPACIASGVPAGIMLTTTAGDIDDPRGREVYKMIAKSMRFVESLYDCTDHAQLKEIVEAQSRNNGMLYLEFSYQQLGRDDAWFRQVTANKSAKKIANDYLNRWTRGAGGALLSAQKLQIISESEREPVTTTFVDSVAINWYVNPELLKTEPYVSKSYIVSSDTSDNVGRDFTTWLMIDPWDLSTVCKFRTNSNNLIHTAKLMFDMLKEFKRSIFIPERNKNGAVLIDYMIAMMTQAGINPFTRIYNQYVQNYKGEDLSEYNLNLGQVRKNFGFNTSNESRPVLFGTVLNTAINLAAPRIFDKDLCSDLRLMTNINGKIEYGGDDGHGDMLIAWLITMWFVLHARNVHMYGIDANELMQNVSDDGSYTDAEDKESIMTMRARTKELASRIASAPNGMVRAALQREYDFLVQALGDKFEESEAAVQSIDKVNQPSNSSFYNSPAFQEIRYSIF